MAAMPSTNDPSPIWKRFARKLKAGDAWRDERAPQTIFRRRPQ
jgi:hypothetical protein